MVEIVNHLGVIEVSENYFSKLIGSIATSCFGVAGMVNSGAMQGIRSFISKKKDFVDKGVTIHMGDNGLCVDLHIVVSYGINISAIVESIVNKVRYTVEKYTGLKVKKVNVYVDDIISE